MLYHVRFVHKARVNQSILHVEIIEEAREEMRETAERCFPKFFAQ